MKRDSRLEHAVRHSEASGRCRLWRVACAGAGLLLSACSLEEYVNEAREGLSKEYENFPAYSEMPIRRLTWAEALAFADENNLEIRKARNEIKNAERNIKRVFLQVVPLVNLGYYYNEALRGNGANYYSEHYDYNVNIIFNIPALTQLPVDYYVAQLALFRAEKNLEIKRREIFSKLYQAAREIDLSRENYLREAALIRGSDAEIRRCELDKKREIEIHAEWMRLAGLFSDASEKWEIDSASLPVVSAEDYAQQTQQIDPLVLTLMATELEASRLAQLGIMMNYFPTVHVNFYSPSLFNYSGGSNTGFTGRGTDLRMELDFFLQLDTRLNTWFALSEAKENHVLLEQGLKLQMIERREKMALILRASREFSKWKNTMRKYNAFLNRRGETHADAILERERASAELDREIANQEKAEIERVAALMLEYGNASFPEPADSAE